MASHLAYQHPLIFVNILERDRALYRNAVRSGNKGRIYTRDRRLKQTARRLYNLAWKEVRLNNFDSSQPYWVEMRRMRRSRLFTFTGLQYMGQSNDTYSYVWKRKGVTFVVKPAGIFIYKGDVIEGSMQDRNPGIGMFAEIAELKRLLEFMPDVPYARPRYVYYVEAPR